MSEPTTCALCGAGGQGERAPAPRLLVPREYLELGIFAIDPLGTAGAAVALALVGSGGSACFFKSVYGVPCPGCGMTRALLALACGDVALAFSFHPLVPLVPFIGLVALFRKTAPFRAMYDGGVFWVACAVCFVGVWAVRMAALRHSNSAASISAAMSAIRQRMP